MKFTFLRASFLFLVCTALYCAELCKIELKGPEFYLRGLPFLVELRITNQSAEPLSIVDWTPLTAIPPLMVTAIRPTYQSSSVLRNESFVSISQARISSGTLRIPRERTPLLPGQIEIRLADLGGYLSEMTIADGAHRLSVSLFSEAAGPRLGLSQEISIFSEYSKSIRCELRPDGPGVTKNSNSLVDYLELSADDFPNLFHKVLSSLPDSQFVYIEFLRAFAHGHRPHLKSDRADIIACTPDWLRPHMLAVLDQIQHSALQSLEREKILGELYPDMRYASKGGGFMHEFTLMELER